MYVLQLITIAYYRPQRSWGKVMFLQVRVILVTGGGSTRPGTPPDQVYPPRPGTPLGPGTHPPRSGTPPGIRYPPGPGTPPRPGTPPMGPGTHHPRDQVHPLRTRYTLPRTRYTPPPRDQGDTCVMLVTDNSTGFCSALKAQ